MKKKTLKAEHVRGKAAYELPTTLTREIGRIIVSFAYFENVVQQTIWETMYIEDAAGRIAVRDPRISDRLEMIRDLLKLQSAKWDDTLFDSILERAKILATKRHLVAHGIWGLIPGQTGDSWHVQLSRGSWPKNVKELVAGSKKVTPEMVDMNQAKLREAAAEIKLLIEDFRKLRASAVNITSSRRKSP